MTLGQALVKIAAWAVRRGIESQPAAKPMGELRGQPTSYDLGILFVHGIGNQAQGQTLTDMGEPLIAWLRRWSLAERDDPDTGDTRGRDTPVKVRSADLAPAGGTQPGNVWVTIAPSKGQPARQWLLAEAWWAEAFRGASYGELFGWGLQAGPLALSGQLALIGRRVWQSIQGAWNFHWLIGLISLPAAGVLFLGLALLTALGAALLTIVSLALLVLALLPIPWLRDAVLSLQLSLANGLGDAYVLVNSPFRFTTMTGRFRNALEWLSPQCAKVVVIAHSQGAMVAYEGLRDFRPANVRRFVTFGQAIMKLKLLRSVHEKGVTPGGAIYWIVMVLSVAALLVALWVFPVVACDVVNCGTLPRPSLLVILSGLWEIATTTAGQYFYGSIAILAAMQLLTHSKSMAGDTSVRSEIRGEIDGWGLVEGQFDWVDLYGTADPVPNGPLVQDTKKETAFASGWVRNRGSTVTDHTTYWTAMTDFVARVALAVAPVGGMSLATVDEGRQIREAIDLRDRRVMFLSCARVIAIFTWLAVLMAIGLRLPVVGQLLAEGPIAWAVSPVGDWLARSSPWIRGTVVVALIGLVCLVWYGIIALTWQMTASNDARRFFRRDSARWQTIPYLGFAVSSASLVAAGALLVTGVTTFERATWYLGALVVGILIFVFFLRLDKNPSPPIEFGLPGGIADATQVPDRSPSPAGSAGP